VQVIFNLIFFVEAWLGGGSFRPEIRNII